MFSVRHVLETLVPQLYFAQNICVLLLTYNRFSSIYNAVKNTRFVPMEGEKVRNLKNLFSKIGKVFTFQWWKSTYFVVFTSLIFCLFVNVASRLFMLGNCRKQ